MSKGKNGDFCSKCGDYIGSPIGRERECQACENYPQLLNKPDSEYVQIKMLTPIGRDKCLQDRFYYKVISEDKFDFYDREKGGVIDRVFRIRGKIKLIYKGITVERATPGGVCIALADLLQ